jgi:lipopolysaccharide transport system permease protein
VYGISLVLASLYVYYRDLNQIWEVVMQLGFFLSPIAYPLSVIPEKYLFWYLLNPITVLMEMYRNFLLYGTGPTLFSFLYIIIAGFILTIFGLVVFTKLERRFAEAI